MTFKKVIVAGAGGNLGPHIATALHNAGFIASILTRSVSKPISNLPQGLTQISTDFSHESLVAAFSGQDAVVSCVGVEGVALQKSMIDAADEVGIKRFIPSEFGWSRDSELLPELSARLKGKDEVFEYLVEKCQTSKTLTWSVIVAGPFLDWTIKIVPALGFNTTNHTARIVDSGNEPISASTGTSIGQATANILLKASQTANRTLRIRSVQFTQNQCLAALEEIIQSKWTVTKVTTQELKKSQAKNLEAKRFPAAFLDVLARQLFEDGAERGLIVPADGNDNELLGVVEESVLDVMRKLVG